MRCAKDHGGLSIPQLKTAYLGVLIGAEGAKMEADTIRQIGSMDASEPSTFNKAVDWYKGRGHWFSPPIVQFKDGKPTVSTTGPDEWADPSTHTSTATGGPVLKAEPAGWQATFESIDDVYDLKARHSSPLAQYYRAHIRDTLAELVKQGKKFGAVMMEPTCLGAGGMLFVDPLFQACLVEVVRASGDLFGANKYSGEGYEEDLSALSRRKGDDWMGLPIVYDEGEFDRTSLIPESSSSLISCIMVLSSE